jgi:hypothetical protein
VATLTEEYDISREQCEAEVSSLLTTLAENRLIEIHHAPSP